MKSSRSDWQWECQSCDLNLWDVMHNTLTKVSHIKKIRILDKRHDCQSAYQLVKPSTRHPMITTLKEDHEPSQAAITIQNVFKHDLHRLPAIGLAEDGQNAKKENCQKQDSVTFLAKWRVQFVVVQSSRGQNDQPITPRVSTTSLLFYLSQLCRNTTKTIAICSILVA